MGGGLSFAVEATSTAFSVIVTIQSGDTLQDIVLVPSGEGWLQLDLIR
jgi:hypothetical protein